MLAPRVSVDTEEGRRIATALGSRKALVLRNHGLLTVGDSVDAAAWWFLSMGAVLPGAADRAGGGPAGADRPQGGGGDP
ncbi:hypothetical protein SGLAM104S_06576 [Streptomyces glaucescens]